MGTEDWSDLARALGASKQAVSQWRRLDGAPESPSDVEAWKAFRDERGLGRPRSNNTQTLADLKAELMREQIELARAKNRREAGDVVERGVVEEMLTLLGQKLDLLLRLKLEVELGPRVAGKSAAEANVEGGLILDEVREVVNANLANFRRDSSAKTRAND